MVPFFSFRVVEMMPDDSSKLLNFSPYNLGAFERLHTHPHARHIPK